VEKNEQDIHDRIYKFALQVLQSVKLPVVAIGGIDPANVEKIKKTGCQRFAVIRAVLGHRNFRRAIKTLLCA